MSDRLDAPPELQNAPKSIAYNESPDGMPFDDGGMIEFERAKWDEPIYKYGEDAAWRVIGDDSEFREHIFGLILVNYTPSGQAYGYVNVERFIPSVAYDKKSRQEIQVRRRILSYAPSGEVIYPTRTEPCFKFLRTHLPPNFTLAEWQPTLRRYKALCDEQERIYNEELAVIADRQARTAQAMAQAREPNVGLASAIAQGVAQALKDLGVTPKKV
jgi:hypothetical protein